MSKSRRVRSLMLLLALAVVVAALTPFVGSQLRSLLEQAFAMVSG